jgi:L-seryl-tRNA(Ser) seleniumtransferase
LSDEPGVRQAVAAGAALVTFSGDKLLGGPQAGVIVGRRELVDRISRHPLARAMRADKLTLAAMQSVALSYLSGDGAAIPLWRMATTPLDELRRRAEAIAADVPGAKVVDTDAAAGGGSLPGLVIPSAGVALETTHVDDVLRALRDRGVVARAQSGAVVCDLRTVAAADDGDLADALRNSVADPV